MPLTLYISRLKAFIYFESTIPELKRRFFSSFEPNLLYNTKFLQHGKNKTFGNRIQNLIAW